MNATELIYACLNCQRNETVIPLVSLRHQGNQAWICSQCLPILIHHPERLTGKLSRTEQIPLEPSDRPGE